MIIHFNDSNLEDLYKLPIGDLGKRQFSKEVIKHFKAKVGILSNANDLSDISKIKGMHLEKLKGKEYKGCYSVRANKQYRIIFNEIKNGKIEILILELSKHYE